MVPSRTTMARAGGRVLRPRTTYLFRNRRFPRRLRLDRTEIRFGTGTGGAVHILRKGMRLD